MNLTYIGLVILRRVVALLVFSVTSPLMMYGQSINGGLGMTTNFPYSLLDGKNMMHSYLPYMHIGYTFSNKSKALSVEAAYTNLGYVYSKHFAGNSNTFIYSTSAPTLLLGSIYSSSGNQVEYKIGMSLGLEMSRRYANGLRRTNSRSEYAPNLQPKAIAQLGLAYTIFESKNINHKLEFFSLLDLSEWIISPGFKFTAEFHDLSRF